MSTNKHNYLYTIFLPDLATAQLKCEVSKPFFVSLPIVRFTVYSLLGLLKLLPPFLFTCCRSPASSVSVVSYRSYSTFLYSLSTGLFHSLPPIIKEEGILQYLQLLKRCFFKKSTDLNVVPYFQDLFVSTHALLSLLITLSWLHPYCPDGLLNASILYDILKKCRRVPPLAAVQNDIVYYLLLFQRLSLTSPRTVTFSSSQLWQ